jgi:hypothetical protein
MYVTSISHLIRAIWNLESGLSALSNRIRRVLGMVGLAEDIQILLLDIDRRDHSHSRPRRHT